MAAPQGNQNYIKGRRWKDAIDRALGKRSASAGVEALDALAEKLLALADDGDLGALRELGDRLDGKPTQLIGGDPENPLQSNMNVNFVGTNSTVPREA